MTKILGKYNKCKELRITGHGVFLSKQNVRVIENAFPNIKVLFFKNFEQNSWDDVFAGFFSDSKIETVYLLAEYGDSVYFLMPHLFLRGDNAYSMVTDIYISQGIRGTWFGWWYIETTFHIHNAISAYEYERYNEKRYFNLVDWNGEYNGEYK